MSNNQNSSAFLIKTNKECMEWMQGFFNADAIPNIDRYCTWAWQEQERRHTAIQAGLIEVIREAADVLEILRRGHGAEVSAACYPALNNLRALLDGARGES